MRRGTRLRARKLKRVRVTQHTKPQDFIIRPPLLTTNNFLNCRYKVLFI
jgi:hypothetical protein